MVKWEEGMEYTYLRVQVLTLSDGKGKGLEAAHTCSS